jgi:hypothetical protein
MVMVETSQWLTKHSDGVPWTRDQSNITDIEKRSCNERPAMGVEVENVTVEGPANKVITDK